MDLSEAQTRSTGGGPPAGPALPHRKGRHGSGSRWEARAAASGAQAAAPRPPSGVDLRFRAGVPSRLELAACSPASALCAAGSTVIAWHRGAVHGFWELSLCVLNLSKDLAWFAAGAAAGPHSLLPWLSSSAGRPPCRTEARMLSFRGYAGLPASFVHSERQRSRSSSAFTPAVWSALLAQSGCDRSLSRPWFPSV